MLIGPQNDWHIKEQSDKAGIESRSSEDVCLKQSKLNGTYNRRTRLERAAVLNSNP